MASQTTARRTRARSPDPAIVGARSDLSESVSQNHTSKKRRVDIDLSDTASSNSVSPVPQHAAVQANDQCDTPKPLLNSDGKYSIDVLIPSKVYPEGAFAQQLAVIADTDWSPLLDVAGTMVTSPYEPADRILLELPRFLLLKIYFADWNCTKLSPTPMMEQLWTAAILNTAFYQPLMEQLGVWIHYEPDHHAAGAVQGRYLQRVSCLRQGYGSFFEALPLGSLRLVATEAKGRELFIKTLTGKMITTRFVPIMTVQDIMLMIHDREGIPVDQQRLIFAGEQLWNHRTLGSYNITANSILQLVLRLRGC